MKNDVQRYIKELSLRKDKLYTVLLERIRNHNPRTLKIISEHAENLTRQEQEIASNYLSIGMFSNLPGQMELACYSIILQAEYERLLAKEKSRCTAYSGNEAIFADKTLGEAREEDLVDYSKLHRDKDSNHIRLGKSWASIDSRISPEFYDWFDRCFVNSPRYVRVDPNSYSTTKPTSIILEVMIQRTIPDWWKNLHIYKGTHQGFKYILQKDIVEDSWDYVINNVRSLEGYISRNNNGNLSMMIEELCHHPHPTDTSKQYVIGHMIHLDTDAQIGTPFDKAILNHIDLAVNLYIDDVANVRLNQSLPNGKTVKATTRTHILKVCNIPFVSLLKFANAFFTSRKLLDEWIDNEWS